MALTSIQRVKIKTAVTDTTLGDLIGDAVDNAKIMQDEIVAGAPMNVTITVAESQTSPRAITVQLKDAAGTNLTASAMVDLVVLAGTTGATLATTGGSTGIAIGANGSLTTILSKKVFKAISNAAGVISLTWTDNAGEVAYLGVVLANGTIVRSAALTTA